jgi:hypothetical protein
MAQDHALKMQMIDNIYLYTTSCNIKYAIYIVSWGYKSQRGKGDPSQSATRHHTSNTSCKNRKEEQKLATKVCCEQI